MKALVGFLANAIRWLDSVPEPEIDSLSMPSTNVQGTFPLDVLVIDTSGSMDETDYHPSRIKAAQEAACCFVRTRAVQTPNGCVAVISFSGNSLVVAAPSLLKTRS